MSRRRPDFGYRVAAVGMKPTMRLWFRIKVEGQDNIPPGGPVIIVANHRSNLDPVLLACGLRRPVFFMAKAELFRFPLGVAMRFIGQFPVQRGGVDRRALDMAAGILARGDMLGLFPEGTRGAGRFDAVHPGLAYIVLREEAPLVPVAMLGTDRARRRFGWLPGATPVRIVVGPRLASPSLGGGREGRRAATERLRRDLATFVAGVDRAGEHAGRR